MILTVTPNSALDRVLFIEEWLPGAAMRTEHVVTAVGGKGLDASVALACLGVPSVALTFVAGQTGRTLVALLEASGVQVAPIWCGGETRTAYVVVERRHGRHSHLMARHLVVTAAHVEAFFAQVAAHLPATSWLVCGGSLPAGIEPGFYGQVITAAAAAGVPALFDPSSTPPGPGLAARPRLLKMNEAEFAAAFGVAIGTEEELRREGRQVSAAFNLQDLVITRGQRGIFAFSDGRTYHAQAPPLEAVNAAGAGDAVSGFLAHRLAQGDGWVEALRWAAAVSAATVLTAETAVCRPADVRRLLPQVTVSVDG